MTAQILKFARPLPGAHPVEAISGCEAGVTEHDAPSPPPFLAGARLTLDTRNHRTVWGITDRHGNYYQLGTDAGGWMTTSRHFEVSPTDPALIDALNDWLHARINHPCVSTRNKQGEHQ